MALEQFNNQLKEELSMVEIATAILSEQQEPMAFQALVAEIQAFLGIDDATFKSRLSQFYTSLNTDGSFISLGRNEWALRAWYPVDAIDESIHEIDDTEEPKRKKAAKKVNVFADSATDDDVIDYSDDDPEDDDFGTDTHDADTANASDDDDSDSDDDIIDDDTTSIDDNLNELAGTDDLDDLGDGDEEK